MECWITGRFLKNGKVVGFQVQIRNERFLGDPERWDWNDVVVSIKAGGHVYPALFENFGWVRGERVFIRTDGKPNLRAIREIKRLPDVSPPQAPAQSRHSERATV